MAGTFPRISASPQPQQRSPFPFIKTSFVSVIRGLLQELACDLEGKADPCPKGRFVSVGQPQGCCGSLGCCWGCAFIGVWSFIWSFSPKSAKCSLPGEPFDRVWPHIRSLRDQFTAGRGGKETWSASFTPTGDRLPWSRSTAAFRLGSHRAQAAFWAPLLQALHCRCFPSTVQRC